MSAQLPNPDQRNQSQAAQPDVPILPALAARWSTRAFADTPVEADKLRRCFEAARWGASSYNEQPWRFLVGEKDKSQATYDKLFDALGEWNQNWAKTAPVLICVVGKLHFSFGEEKEAYHSKYDCGNAAGFFTAQAAHEGLNTHQMAGFVPQKVVDAFGIPADRFWPYTMMAVGYVGDLAQIDEQYHSDELKPRTRKPISETVLQNWGEAYPFE